MTEAEAGKAALGVVGLGVMGRNLALNAEEHGFVVRVWNLETEWVDRFVTEHAGKRSGSLFSVPVGPSLLDKSPTEAHGKCDEYQSGGGNQSTVLPQELLQPIGRAWWPRPDGFVLEVPAEILG